MKAAGTCSNFEWIVSHTGVREPPLSCVSGYFVTILLLQTVLTSGKFAVTSSWSPRVVMVGGHTELTCQLSPPRSAEHMQVGWYRGHYQLLSIYEKGETHPGRSTQNHDNRTVLLRDALGEGRMTLRIHNVSVFDEGQYHCFFKDDDTSQEAVTDLKVAALGLEIQIHVQVSDEKGLLLECTSGGWFPQPRMEWRDSRGKVIPASSRVFSQDEAGLLHLNMTLFLEKSTHDSVTCCFLNPVTGQEKRAGIILPDILFKVEDLSTIPCVVLWLLIYSVIVCAHLFRSKVLKGKPPWFCYIFDSLPFLMHASILLVYREFSNRVSVLGDLGSFYNIWMRDMSVILGILMVFFTLLILFLLYTLGDTQPVDFTTPIAKEGRSKHCTLPGRKPGQGCGQSDGYVLAPAEVHT